MTGSIIDILNGEQQAAFDKALEFRFLADIAYHSQIVFGNYDNSFDFKDYIIDKLLTDHRNDVNYNYELSPYFTLNPEDSVFQQSDINKLISIVDNPSFNYTMRDYGTSVTGANVLAFVETDVDNNKVVTVSINGTDLDFTANPIESFGDVINDIFLVGIGAPPPQVFEVIATLDQMKTDLSVSNFNLTGHSLGANVVKWIKALRPDLVEEAIVFNPPGVGGVVGTILNWATFGTLENILDSLDGITTYQNTGDVARLVGVNLGSTQMIQDPFESAGLNSHTNGTLIALIRHEDPNIQGHDPALPTHLATLYSNVRRDGENINTSINGNQKISTYELVDDGRTIRFEVTTEYDLDSNGNIIAGSVPREIIKGYVDGNIYLGDINVFKDLNGRVHVEVIAYDENGNKYLTDEIVGQGIGSPTIIIPNNQDIPFELIGGKIGSLVADYFSNGEVIHDVLLSTFLVSSGQHYGTFARFIEAGFDISTSWDGASGDFGGPEFAQTFVSNLTSNINGRISAAITEEFVGILDIDTTSFGGGVLTTAIDTVTLQFLNETIDVVFSNINSNLFSGIADGGFFTKPVFDSSGAQIYELNGVEVPAGTEGATPKFKNVDVQALVVNALASYVGGRLAGEVIEPESQIAGIFGSLGSAFGSAVGAGSIGSASLQSFLTLGAGAGPLGIAVAAFVGTVVGTAFGNLLGSDDEPQAWAHIVYDKDDQAYRIGANYGSDGGDPAVAQSMAQQVIQGINDIIEISQGKLRSGASAPRVQIGFEGNEFQVAIGGGGVKSFGTTADAIHYAAFKIMKDFDLVGGHMVTMRAWHNSDATNIYEWLEDIQVAEAFQNYLANPTAILALMMNDPTSDLAQSWAAILQRAAELELHLPHEKDLDGGWGEVLLAQGVSTDFIPDITGNTLTLTDPITGEERVLHHIIGPGYEIIRIEGTDGDDIIEVIVDGPSITYVDGGEGNDTIEGSDQADVLVGGTGDDIINGHGGNDWLHGGAGNDTLDGGAGEDLVVGGEQNDLLFGNTETDHIYGNGGDDFLYGNAGKDFLFGGAGNDVLDAGEGQFDEVYGGEGDDTLYIGDKHKLVGGRGNDTFDLTSSEGYRANLYFGRGDGHDVIRGYSSGYTHLIFNSSIGINELFLQREGQNLAIYILGEDQSITVEDYYGGAGIKPTISLFAATGSIRANYQESSALAISEMVIADNTIAEVPTGSFNVVSDAALAAATSDLEYAPLWSGVDVTFKQLGDEDNSFISTSERIIYGGAGNDTLTDIHDGSYGALYGDSGDDTLYGLGGHDVLVGGLGNDTIFGSTGNDTIYGGHGDDYISGGSWNDLINGGAGNDIIDAGEDDDNIVGESGDDIIDAGAGNDLAKGNEGNDQIEGNAGNDTLYGGLGNDIISGGSGIDTIFGDEGNDTISGGSDDDWISGGAGADIIDGNQGNDIINAGEGDDILSYVYGENVGSENNYDGGEGNDKLILYLTAAEYVLPQIQREIVRFQSEQIFRENSTTLTSAVFTFSLLNLIVQNIENIDVYVDDVLQSYSFNTVLGTEIDETLNGSSSEDVVIGEDGADQIFGLVGDDDLRGGHGDDTIEGGLGSDILYGDSGADILSGDEGDDHIFAGNGDDNIAGGQGNDYIEGNNGNDVVTGDAGTDIILGGDGDDILIGGTGNDTIFGGEGNDEYQFNIGDGEDIYTDISGENDRIRLGSGIVFSDLSFSNHNGSDLIINFINNPSDKITLANHYVSGSAYKIEKIIFDDLSEFDLITLSLNADPIARNDDFFIAQAQSLAGNVLVDNGYGVDTDPEGDNISVQAGIYATSQGGEVTILENGDFTYTIDNSYSGNDSFNYTVLDDQGGSDLGTVNITIDPLPIINGTSGNNTLNGSTSAEFIYGLAGKDIIYGKDGNDYLYGGEGADKIYGDEGDDYIEDLSTDGTVDGYVNWMWGGTGNDIMIGGEGKNIYQDGYGDATYNLMYDSGTTDDWYSYWIGGDLVRVTDLGGFSDNQSIYNKILTFSNVIYERYMDTDLVIKNTDGRVNIVHTDTFTDLNNITGVGVEEIYISGAWRNLKSIILNYSNIMITRGSDGDDVINGINIANRDDEIYAGAGDDILFGDDGLDIIYGGAGADTFGFRAASAYQNVDVIKDFNLSEDDIVDLSDLLTAYDPLTDSITDFVQFTDNGTDTTISVDADGGADNFIQIARLDYITGLTDEVALVSNGTLLV